MKSILMEDVGKVYLVGAGPGDPGLISLKALECLRCADLVLYDGLVNPLLIRDVSDHAKRTCRSLAPGGRVLKQVEINEQLIAAARQGKTVVRLKGGDPFIFGRGSEEATALARAGIPFEVVPGVTAATAASEYAGISLTHRDYASAVAFITGHEHPSKDKSSLDYRVLAQFPGTLVFYMGLHRLEWIVQSLLESGKPPETPAAVISSATLPSQRTVVASLGDLPAAVRAADLHAPSVILVGDCVKMRREIAWFERRPLFGKRIGITRPAQQAGPTINKIVALGGQPVLLPTIAIEPPEDWRDVDATINRLEEFDWIVFTSVNGVHGLLGRIWELGGDVRKFSAARLAVIGSSTSEALEQYHLRADVMPQSFRAEELAAALRMHVSGKHVLWARASRGRDVLPVELTAAGATVEELVVYRNIDVDSLPPENLAMIENGELDWIGLSSPSIARSLCRLLTPKAVAQLGFRVRLASISPVTTEAAGKTGLPVAVEAQTYTWDGILDAIASAERSA